MKLSKWWYEPGGMNLVLMLTYHLGIGDLVVLEDRVLKTMKIRCCNR